MSKSSIIMAPVSLVVMIGVSIVNLFCCVCSPLTAPLLGLAAGGLCVYFEKPADAEKAFVRGGLAGLIAGAGGLVGQMIGETALTFILGAGKTPEACPLQICSIASAPASQTAYDLNVLFYSCFCGLVVLALMAGFGALGGVLWNRYGKSILPKPPAGTSAPSIP